MALLVSTTSLLSFIVANGRSRAGMGSTCSSSIAPPQSLDQSAISIDWRSPSYRVRGDPLMKRWSQVMKIQFPWKLSLVACSEVDWILIIYPSCFSSWCLGKLVLEFKSAEHTQYFSKACGAGSNSSALLKLQIPYDWPHMLSDLPYFMNLNVLKGSWQQDVPSRVSLAQYLYLGLIWVRSFLLISSLLFPRKMSRLKP